MVLKSRTSLRAGGDRLITNQREEALLGSSSYQDKLADSLLDGVRGYFSSYRPLQQVADTASNPPPPKAKRYRSVWPARAAGTPAPATEVFCAACPRLSFQPPPSLPARNDPGDAAVSAIRVLPDLLVNQIAPAKWWSGRPRWSRSCSKTASTPAPVASKSIWNRASA